MKSLKHEIERLIQQSDWKALASHLKELPAPELADWLNSLSEAHCAAVCRTLPPEKFAETFAHFDGDRQNALTNELTDQEMTRLLTDLRPDDRTRFLEHLPKETTEKLLRLLSREDLTESRQLLAYPEESVGRLMTPEFIAVQADWTIEQALAHIRVKGQKSEVLSTIYVTTEDGKLIDALELERFVLADPADRVSQIMDRSFVALSPTDDREEAVRQIQKYDLYAIPVIDADKKLLGIVTADDVMDIAEEETTEDVQKGAAVDPLETSYRDSTIWSLYRKRAPWLVTLVFVNLAASGVIAVYEDTLASALALAFFIPLLMGAGGNTGSQSAMLIVRALATGDLKGSRWLSTFAKELVVGGTLGVTLGIGIGWLGVLRGDFAVGVAVALAMTSIVLVSNLLGVLFPLILTKLRIDPAVASSPMVTSTADVTSLLLYFSIATFILGYVARG
ncbi:MAG TPA: magnesium transporter [Candidatus Binatia bacterium]|nr:magnesium transporter [Candidatus Binatia bacterium]